MTPREFLKFVVIPNIEDAGRDVSDIRATYNAIMATDALAAHVFHWCRENAPQAVERLLDDTAYRHECGRRHEYVRLLHDVAKAAKHVQLTRGAPAIETFANVQPRSFGYGEGVYGGGPYGGGSQISVMIEGRKVQISVLIKGTADYYESQMDAVGMPLANE